ncbi:cytochrome P450 4g15-like, partial [Contarinia nasturtii]|uniref:cytochrome P450 4g15-like n=1 Tax=Contarinia nasturtii TaxID=265458 RepID=UPI0012D3B3FE
MFVLLSILIALVTYLLWSRRSLYKLSWQLPGPFAYPIIGNAMNLHPDNLHSYLDRISKTYGSPIRCWLGPILVVFITDAENVEIIMKSKDCLNKPHTFYKMVKDGLGVDGLVTITGEKWRIHRRLVNPTLNQSAMRMHLPVFNENIKKQVLGLPTNEYFDILPSIIKCYTNMFIEAALGLDWKPEVKQKYLEQNIKLHEILAERFLQPLFHVDLIWNFTRASKLLKEYGQYTRQLCKNILNNESRTDQSFIGRLSIVSKINPKFTKEDVIAETGTILISASETAAAASAFVALMLAMHPEHQEKVYHEITTIIPDKNADFSHEDLNKLEFTDLCIKETLRLFPTGSIIGRISSKSIKLSNKVEVPPNVPLMFGLRQLHTQNKYFGATANVFDPYRFLDEKIKNLPSAAYIPFSYGPRDCVGIYYANASVKCFTAH